MKDRMDNAGYFVSGVHLRHVTHACSIMVLGLVSVLKGDRNWFLGTGIAQITHILATCSRMEQG